jgi:hypothetical protein
MLAVGLVFIVTVLAYAVMPVLEEKAKDAGAFVPPREESWFRNELHHHGWKWVLGEVVLLVVLGLASMGLDRWRRWKEELANPAAPQADANNLETPKNTNLH